MLLYSAGNARAFPKLPRVASRIAVDRLGRVYVMTKMKTRLIEGVFRYTADGKADARLSELTSGSPAGMAVSDCGGYAILDERKPHVRVHDPSGWLVERFGEVQEEPVAFRMPRRIAMTRREGNVALLMPPSRRGGFERTTRVPALQVFDPWGELLRHAGKLGKRAGEFTNACDVDTDRKGNVYILDSRLFRISVFSSRGAGATPEKEREFARGRRRGHELGRPTKLAVDPDTCDFYVFDARGREVKKFSETASFVGAAGRDLGLTSVRRMAVDHLGFVWVLDSKEGRLRRIDFRGDSPGDTLSLSLDEVAGAVIDFGLDASGRIYVLTARDLVYVYR
jgi:DNA-binding beta-propeller fold protein YncE